MCLFVCRTLEHVKVSEVKEHLWFWRGELQSSRSNWHHNARLKRKYWCWPRLEVPSTMQWWLFHDTSDDCFQMGMLASIHATLTPPPQPLIAVVILEIQKMINVFIVSLPGRTVSTNYFRSYILCSNNWDTMFTITAIAMLKECVGLQKNWDTKKIWEPFTKHMVEIVLVQLTGARQLPVNDKLMSPLPISLWMPGKLWHKGKSLSRHNSVAQ